MSWKNVRDVKRDIKEWKKKVPTSTVAIAIDQAEDLGLRATSLIRDKEIRDLNRSLLAAQGEKLSVRPEHNALKFAVHELVRHVGHVRTISNALAKALEDPDGHSQALILTLKHHRLNPDISDLVREFGLDTDVAEEPEVEDDDIILDDEDDIEDDWFDEDEDEDDDIIFEDEDEEDDL